MKKIISRFIFLCLLIVFIGSGFLLFQNVKEKYQFRQLEKQVENEKPILVDEEYDFTELLETNGDTIGWILITGTSIDHPIVQASDNSYYLTHDFNHAHSNYGSIFMDYRNAADFSDNHTIIYGHNMRNGTMFHDLNEYSNQEFWDEHAFIDVYSPDGYRKWEIFSTYSTETNFDYLQTEFNSPEDYAVFINVLLSKSEWSNDGIQVTVEDRILTLSTCSNDSGNSRRVVHAKLVEEALNDV